MNKLFRHLTYDSQLFGYKVAMIYSEAKVEELPVIIEDLKKENYRLAYWVTPDIQDIRIQSDVQKISYAGAKVIYSKDMNETHLNSNSYVVEYPEKTASDKLIELALQSGIYSRFKTDTFFENKEFEKLYKEWIAKSVSHEIADKVFVYQDESFEILGMVTISIKEGVSTIGLIAVDELARGKSIGKNLLLKVEEVSLTNQCKKSFVATQKENLDACRFYEKNGYSVSEISYLYHFWL